MSSFSPDLRIELITTGDQAGVWGNTTNVNLGTILENAIAGYTSVSITASPQALTANPGATDEARFAAIALVRASGGDFTVCIPPNSKLYTFYNTSSYVATISNSTADNGTTLTGGSTVVIPANKIVTVWSDGSNVYFQNTHVGSLTAPTGAAKDATTQVATDEFVDRLRSFLSSSTSGTAVVSDRGCLLPLTAGITIPASTFAANDAFTIFNNSGSNITITQGSGLTMYWAGPASTGNRTLAGRGLCSVIFISATVCAIAGAGLS